MKFETTWTNPNGMGAQQKQQYWTTLEGFERDNRSMLWSTALAMLSQKMPVDMLTDEDRARLLQDMLAANETVFRWNDVSTSSDTLTLQYHIRRPSLLNTYLREHVEKRLDAMNKHWLMRLTDFLGRKLLKDEFEKVDHEERAATIQNIMNEHWEHWDQVVFSAWIGSVGESVRASLGTFRSFLWKGDERLEMFMEHLWNESVPPPDQLLPNGQIRVKM